MAAGAGTSAPGKTAAFAAFYFFSDVLLISVILNRLLAQEKHGIEFFLGIIESVHSFCKCNALCLIPHTRGYMDEHKGKAFHFKKIFLTSEY